MENLEWGRKVDYNTFKILENCTTVSLRLGYENFQTETTNWTATILPNIQ